MIIWRWYFIIWTLCLETIFIIWTLFVKWVDAYSNNICHWVMHQMHNYTSFVTRWTCSNNIFHSSHESSDKYTYLAWWNPIYHIFCKDGKIHSSYILVLFPNPWKLHTLELQPSNWIVQRIICFGWEHSLSPSRMDHLPQSLSTQCHHQWINSTWSYARLHDRALDVNCVQSSKSNYIQV